MTEHDMERMVGGIRCLEVLARLSAYVDGELSDQEVGRVEAHLKGCDRCERFGGAFGRVVEALRREAATPDPLDPEVAARLRRRLARST